MVLCSILVNAAWIQDGSTATDGNWILRIQTTDGVVKKLGPNAGSGVLDISTIANVLGCTGVIVGNEAFLGNTNITGLVLLDDLLELCDGAFDWFCQKLLHIWEIGHLNA